MSLKKLPVLNAVLAGLMLSVSVFAIDPKLPRPLADISLDAPGAKRVKVNQPKAKARVIAVLSSECADCAAMVGSLSKLERQYRARGVVFYGALVDEQAAQQLQKFIAKTSPSFPIGTLSQDNTRRLADFGINDHPFVPSLLFVDGNNVVRYQFSGDQGVFKNNTENSLKNMIEVVLKQK
jgi:thiol-disulfide isomerase/thioredoxin